MPVAGCDLPPSPFSQACGFSSRASRSSRRAATISASGYGGPLWPSSSSNLRGAGVALEMAKARRPHNARQIVHLRIAAETSRQSTLRAFELVERAITRSANTRWNIGPAMIRTRCAAPSPASSTGPSGAPWRYTENHARTRSMRLAAQRWIADAGDENASAPLLERIERIRHTLKIAVHNAASSRRFAGVSSKLWKVKNFCLGIEPMQEIAGRGKVRGGRHASAPSRASRARKSSSHCVAFVSTVPIRRDGRMTPSARSARMLSASSSRGFGRQPGAQSAPIPPAPGPAWQTAFFPGLVDRG